MISRTLAVLFTCCISFIAVAQTTKAIAPFSIEQVNHKTFTYKQLKPNTPTVLVYFSPTCEHCKDFVKELLKQKTLASKQIVLVTYLPVEELKPFADEFKLNKYSTIKTGTEGYTFLVRKYYDVQRFPFIAVYDKQLQLKKILPYTEDGKKAVAQLVKLW